MCFGEGRVLGGRLDGWRLADANDLVGIITLADWDENDKVGSGKAKLDRLTSLQNNTVSQYLTGNRHPKGGRTKSVMGALLWNIESDRYHKHLHEMMWATYWAEQDTYAPELIQPEKAFLEWARGQDKHPILGTLPTSLQYNPTVNWPLHVSAA